MKINVLETILKEIKKAKKEHGLVDMKIFDNWKYKFMIRDDVIVELVLD